MPDATPVLLTEATTDQLAEAIAAGVHVGLRRLAMDLEAQRELVKNVEKLRDEFDR